MLSAEKAPISAGRSIASHGGGLKPSSSREEIRYATQRGSMRSPGSKSGFYKGLIQVAAGCLHYTRHNRRGAVNKWRSGVAYLRPYLPEHRGVRLAPPFDGLEGVLPAMAGGERAGPAVP